MKVFLDTANLDAIKKYSALGIIDGVTTNPSNLSKEGKDPLVQVKAICSLFPKGDVSVEVTEIDASKLYEQAKKIAQLGSNVSVKIPCHIDYYSVIDRLVKEGIGINVTLVFTVIQALMMCKFGVRYVSAFVGRWDDIGALGNKNLSDMRRMMDDYNYETYLLAASLRTVLHFQEAIMIGVDVVTVPPSLLDKGLRHPLTDQGIKIFDSNWKKLGISHFP